MPLYDESASEERSHVEGTDTMRPEESKRWYARIRWWGWTLIALAAILASLAGVYGVQAMQIKKHEYAAINVVKSALTYERFSDPEALMADVQRETESARSIAHNGWWNALASMPGLGADIGALQHVTDILNDLALQTLPEYARAFRQVDVKSMFSEGALNAQPLVDVTPALKSANMSLSQRLREYRSVSCPRLGVLASAFRAGEKALESADRYASMLTDTVLPNVQQWLGYDGKRTYAVLAMTPAEMRGSGGLVGAVGTVAVDHGRIHIGEFQNNSDFSEKKATNVNKDEYALYQLDGPLHLRYDVRDVTNAPSTQRVAQLFENIWKQSEMGKNTDLSGVILADPVVVQSLVKASGDVVLTDGKVLTGSNTAEYLMNTVYLERPSTETNQVFGEVAKICVSRLTSHLNTGTLKTLLKDLNMLTRYRHLAAYSFNPALEKVLAEFGLTATVPNKTTEPEIGIYTTEKNPSKMDWYVKRSTTIQQINCESNAAAYHVEYTISNTVTWDEVDTLPPYISSYTKKYPQRKGMSMETIVFYPPAGGRLSNFSVEGGGSVPTTGALEWRQIYHTFVELQPEQTVTYSFDVNVSKDAVQKLEVDETPSGNETNNIRYAYLCPVG